MRQAPGQPVVEQHSRGRRPQAWEREVLLHLRLLLGASQDMDGTFHRAASAPARKPRANQRRRARSKRRAWDRSVAFKRCRRRRSKLDRRVDEDLVSVKASGALRNDSDRDEMMIEPV